MDEILHQTTLLNAHLERAIIQNRFTNKPRPELLQLKEELTVILKEYLPLEVYYKDLVYNKDGLDILQFNNFVYSDTETKSDDWNKPLMIYSILRVMTNVVIANVQRAPVFSKLLSEYFEKSRLTSWQTTTMAGKRKKDNVTSCMHRLKNAKFLINYIAETNPTDEILGIMVCKEPIKITSIIYDLMHKYKFNSSDVIDEISTDLDLVIDLQEQIALVIATNILVKSQSKIGEFSFESAAAYKALMVIKNAIKPVPSVSLTTINTRCLTTINASSTSGGTLGRLVDDFPNNKQSYVSSFERDMLNQLKWFQSVNIKFEIRSDASNHDSLRQMCFECAYIAVSSIVKRNGKSIRLNAIANAIEIASKRKDSTERDVLISKIINEVLSIYSTLFSYYKPPAQLDIEQLDSDEVPHQCEKIVEENLEEMWKRINKITTLKIKKASKLTELTQDSIEKIGVAFDTKAVTDEEVSILTISTSMIKLPFYLAVSRTCKRSFAVIKVNQAKTLAKDILDELNSSTLEEDVAFNLEQKVELYNSTQSRGLAISECGFTHYLWLTTVEWDDSTDYKSDEITFLADVFNNSNYAYYIFSFVNETKMKRCGFNVKTTASFLVRVIPSSNQRTMYLHRKRETETEGESIDIFAQESMSALSNDDQEWEEKKSKLRDTVHFMKELDYSVVDEPDKSWFMNESMPIEFHQIYTNAFNAAINKLLDGMPDGGALNVLLSAMHPIKLTNCFIRVFVSMKDITKDKGITLNLTILEPSQDAIKILEVNNKNVWHLDQFRVIQLHPLQLKSAEQTFEKMDLIILDYIGCIGGNYLLPEIASSIPDSAIDTTRTIWIPDRVLTYIAPCHSSMIKKTLDTRYLDIYHAPWAVYSTIYDLNVTDCLLADPKLLFTFKSSYRDELSVDSDVTTKLNFVVSKLKGNNKSTQLTGFMCFVEYLMYGSESYGMTTLPTKKNERFLGIPEGFFPLMDNDTFKIKSDTTISLTVSRKHAQKMIYTQTQKLNCNIAYYEWECNFVNDKLQQISTGIMNENASVSYITKAILSSETIDLSKVNADEVSDDQVIARDEKLGLEVKKSRIPNAGFGLFTTKDIKLPRTRDKRTKIIEYTGKVLNAEELKKEYKGGLGPYVLKVDSDTFIDAIDPNKSSLARYINDGNMSGTSREKGVKFGANTTWLTNTVKKTIHVVATKPIKAGDELYVSYGKDYWSMVSAEKKKKQKQKQDTSKDINVEKKKIDRVITTLNQSGIPITESNIKEVIHVIDVDEEENKKGMTTNIQEQPHTKFTQYTENVARFLDIYKYDLLLKRSETTVNEKNPTFFKLAADINITDEPTEMEMTIMRVKTAITCCKFCEGFVEAIDSDIPIKKSTQPLFSRTNKLLDSVKKSLLDSYKEDPEQNPKESIKNSLFEIYKLLHQIINTIDTEVHGEIQYEPTENATALMQTDSTRAHPRHKHSKSDDMIDISVSVEVELKNATQNTTYPSIGHSIEVFISRGVCPDGCYEQSDCLKTTFKLQSRVNTNIAEIPTNGIIGFRLMRHFHPKDAHTDEEFSTIKKEPIADAYIHLSNVVHASTLKLDMKDTCYPIPPENYATVIVVFDDVKIPQRVLNRVNLFKDEIVLQSTVGGVIDRYYSYINTLHPIKEVLSTYHVPRYPSIVGILPSSSWCAEVDRNVAHASLELLKRSLDVSLEVNGITKETFISTVKAQMSSKKYDETGAFNACLRVVFDSTTLFATACDYKPDLHGETMCEKFIDMVRTTCGDCEDPSFTCIYALCSQMIQLNLDRKDVTELVACAAQCMKLFVPSIVVDGAAAPKKESRETARINKPICHIYVCAMRRMQFLNRLDVKDKSLLENYMKSIQEIREWEIDEDNANTWILEGTNFYNPYSLPIHMMTKTTALKKAVLERDFTLQKNRIEFDGTFSDLLTLELVSQQKKYNLASYEQLGTQDLSEFYRTPLTLSTGYLLQCGMMVSSLTLGSTKKGRSSKVYGTQFANVVFMKGVFSIYPSFVYKKNEWDLISDYINMLPPMGIMQLKAGYSNQNKSIQGGVPPTSSDPLSMMIPNWITYRLNNINNLTEQIEETLIKITKDRDLGYSKLFINMYELFSTQLVDIKLAK